MSTFPTKPDFHRPLPTRWTPTWTGEPAFAGDYAGAHKRSDAATLSNVPPRERVPGQGMPGEPWQSPKMPERRRLR